MSLSLRVAIVDEEVSAIHQRLDELVAQYHHQQALENTTGRDDAAAILLEMQGMEQRLKVELTAQLDAIAADGVATTTGAVGRGYLPAVVAARLNAARAGIDDLLHTRLPQCRDAFWDQRIDAGRRDLATMQEALRNETAEIAEKMATAAIHAVIFGVPDVSQPGSRGQGGGGHSSSLTAASGAADGGQNLSELKRKLRALEEADREVAAIRDREILSGTDSSRNLKVSTAADLVRASQATQLALQVGFRSLEGCKGLPSPNRVAATAIHISPTQQTGGAVALDPAAGYHHLGHHASPVPTTSTPLRRLLITATRAAQQRAAKLIDICNSMENYGGPTKEAQRIVTSLQQVARASFVVIPVGPFTLGSERWRYVDSCAAAPDRSDDDNRLVFGSAAKTTVPPTDNSHGYFSTANKKGAIILFPDIVEDEQREKLRYLTTDSSGRTDLQKRFAHRKIASRSDAQLPETWFPVTTSDDRCSRLDRRTQLWLSSKSHRVVEGIEFLGGPQHYFAATLPRKVLQYPLFYLQRTPMTVRQYRSLLTDRRYSHRLPLLPETFFRRNVQIPSFLCGEMQSVTIEPATVGDLGTDASLQDAVLEVPFHIAEQIAAALGGIVAPLDLYEAATRGLDGEPFAFDPEHGSRLQSVTVPWGDNVWVDAGSRSVQGKATAVIDLSCVQQASPCDLERVARHGAEWNSLVLVDDIERTAPGDPTQDFPVPSTHVIRSASDYHTQTQISRNNHPSVVSDPVMQQGCESGFIGPALFTYGAPHRGLAIAGFRVAVPATTDSLQAVASWNHEQDAKLGRSLTFPQLAAFFGSPLVIFYTFMAQQASRVAADRRRRDRDYADEEAVTGTETSTCSIRSATHYEPSDQLKALWEAERNRSISAVDLPALRFSECTTDSLYNDKHLHMYASGFEFSFASMAPHALKGITLWANALDVLAARQEANVVSLPVVEHRTYGYPILTESMKRGSSSNGSPAAPKSVPSPLTAAPIHHSPSKVHLAAISRSGSLSGGLMLPVAQFSTVVRPLLLAHATSSTASAGLATDARGGDIPRFEVLSDTSVEFAFLDDVIPEATKYRGSVDYTFAAAASEGARQPLSTSTSTRELPVARHRLKVRLFIDGGDVVSRAHVELLETIVS